MRAGVFPDVATRGPQVADKRVVVVAGEEVVLGAGEALLVALNDRPVGRVRERVRKGKRGSMPELPYNK
jgi:hypothetical protein